MNRKRLADWRPRLDAVIAAGRRAAFVWGSHDCMAFPARGVEAVTGRDHFEPFRGRYSDEGGARALMPDMEAYLRELAAREGWEGVSGPLARRGDLGMINLRGVWVCALAYDGWLVPRKTGYTVFPPRAAGLAWSVGSF